MPDVLSEKPVNKKVYKEDELSIIEIPTEMSSEAENELNLQQQRELLRIARESIEYGLQHHHALAIDLNACDEQLQQQGASFVTLNKKGALRGCIGTLQPYQALVSDVGEHARAAAFSDPRFPPVTLDELADIVISISVLGKPRVISFKDEEELIEQLRPAEDGLILQEGANRGTFLPSVWEQISSPRDFVHQLKLKAGLAEDFWSEDLVIETYQTDVID